MRTITTAEAIVTSPGRNYIIIKIVTSDGIVGWGDATLNGRELSVVSYLQDHILPTLIGKNPDNIEDIWQYLYRGAYWRRGPVTMAAIGGIDLALWDIKGKVAGLPVYQLLGGATRNSLLAYCHTFGEDIEQLLGAVDKAVDQGFRAIRVQASVPGVQDSYGVGHSESYEPASGLQPHEEQWSSREYLAFAPTMLGKVREHLGDSVEILHDVHHRLTPIQAAQLAKSVEQHNLFWLEDLTPTENQEILRLIREHSTTPIATGEVHNTIWDTKDLIINQQIDYVRTCVMHGGGITHVRKIWDLADLYQIKGAPHGPSDVSPLTMAASIHLGISHSAFGIQEHMGYPSETFDVFAPGYELKDGRLYPSSEPGLGVEIDEQAAKAYPYQPAYLPVARTVDGAMTNW